MAARAIDPVAKAGDAGSNTAAKPNACAGESQLREPRAVLASIGQYMNTLRDLLGPQAVSMEDATASGKLEFEIVDRARMTTATLDLVLRLAERGVESVRGRVAGLLGCSTLDDAACVRAGLAAFARRAFKRPIDQVELDDIMGVRAAGLDGGPENAEESATLLALQAILVAPSTLYRTEFLGTPSATTIELSPHERAAAVAALLLDSVPDQALLAAADDGSLMTRAGLQAQLDRLLESPRVRQHLTGLILNAYKVPKVFETAKDVARFPEYTPELQASMYEESRRFVDDVLWGRAAPLDELLTSRRTFVDARLAALYGVPAAGGGESFAPIEHPEQRAGLLTQASVMTVLSRTDKTSVVARGLFVRGPVLCLPEIPAPPPSVQAQVAEQLGAGAPERELAEYRARTSPCSSCHSQFDPFGLLLEAFDPIGRARAEPAPAEALALPSPLQGSVENPAQFARQSAVVLRFTHCLAERTAAYALTEPREATTDPCALGSLEQALAQGGASMAALISALVHDPIFLQRRAGP